MQQLWINKKGNANCILFFNGWGMDENAIRHIDSIGFDLYMFNNYKSIVQVNNEFDQYRTIYLVAWSLGVWAAEQVMSISKINITKHIAINGTSIAIHNEWGIPENIFSSTLRNWNSTNREKFNIRMMGGSKNLTEHSSYMSIRTIDDTREELEAIYKISKNNIQPHLSWNKAIIGKNDLIFTSENQENWWNGKTTIVKNEHPHFPFIGIKNWSQIVTI